MSWAGTLLRGAFFHMIPESVEALGNRLWVYVWVVAGFIVFFVLEQFLHWHHCHKSAQSEHRPLGHMILVADGLHNLIGALAVGGAFVVDIRVGIVTWFVAAAHEVPQEFGDFIAAADLIPEIARETRARDKVETTTAFAVGLALLLAVAQAA